MIGQLGSILPPVIIFTIYYTYIYIKCIFNYLPVQGRARVVGVVAGTGLLKVAVSALRRSTSNSVSFLHNSSLSFSLFFSLTLQNISIDNIKAIDEFHFIVFQKQIFKIFIKLFYILFFKIKYYLLLPFRLIAGSKFIKELAIHFHKCF